MTIGSSDFTCMTEKHSIILLCVDNCDKYISSFKNISPKVLNIRNVFRVITGDAKVIIYKSPLLFLYLSIITNCFSLIF